MRVSVLILLTASFVLASCGSVRESRFNPVNWFGSSTSSSNEVETTVNASGEVVPVNPLIGNKRRGSQIVNVTTRSTNAIDRARILRDKDDEPYTGTLVDQVTSLEIKRTTTGGIVSVSGLTTRQGAFDVRLVPRNQGIPVDGVLTYELRALQPIETLQGPERTRRIQAAAPLSVQELELIRTVQVVARRNTRTSRR
ncbi:MAG: hypothetical protein AAF280_10040 [Pseudomonadota bacterium]